LKNVRIFGSGQSAPTLIQYLATCCRDLDLKITIADKQRVRADKYMAGLHNCDFLKTDITDETQRNQLVEQADVVLSMVPAQFHPLVLKSCLKHKKTLLTPSYESIEMKQLSSEIDDAGIFVLNEMGLDPGIDHMSAMKVIDEIKEAGNEISAFESFTGGLMAPGFDSNPWQYKFTWNPRNVVLAGQGGTVRFLHNGRHKFIPYGKLFRRTERIEIEGFGKFEGYANRDSLSYIEKYGLDDISTIYRGTLRRTGFCKAWDLLVQLGVTDDSFVVEAAESMTHREFINSFLPYNPHDSVELKLMYYLRIDQDSELMEILESIGLFSEDIIGLSDATPAMILEHILKKVWTMEPEDKDMIVMWHKFFYETKTGRSFQKTSSLVAIGEGADHTAMARTVGLPMGIAAKLILQNRIKLTGLHLPVRREIYLPVLKELEQSGIVFKEHLIEKQDNDENKPVF
jgi:saccharopine dehydrogenase-like NADP-dependent oxidoreductase